MRALVAAALAVGCGGAQVPEVPATERVDPPAAAPSRMRAGAPRPVLDISAWSPDPMEHGRWPLTSSQHPVLEPAFDIAGALAVPGVSWLALCERGAQNRTLGAKQDLTRYLSAWCAVARHDAPGALYELGQLRSTAIAGLWVAAKHDAANILSDHGSASDVEHLLRASGLLEVEVADLTSAAYFEAGRREDALTVNELAASLDRGANDDSVCERLARAAVAGDERRVGAIIGSLAEYAKAHPTSTTCRARAAELRCWHAPARACADYFAVQHHTPGELALFEAYELWPASAATVADWLLVAGKAVDAVPLGEAIRFGVPALELAIRNSACGTDVLETVVTRAQFLFDRTLTAAPIDARRVGRLLEVAKRLARLAQSRASACMLELEALPPMTSRARRVASRD